MYIDPEVINWIFYGAASFCGYMIGRIYGAGDKEAVIEDTIDHLIENGFIKTRMEGDEIVLLKKDE